MCGRCDARDLVAPPEEGGDAGAGAAPCCCCGGGTTGVAGVGLLAGGEETVRCIGDAAGTGVGCAAGCVGEGKKVCKGGGRCGDINGEISGEGPPVLMEGDRRLAGLKLPRLGENCCGCEVAEAGDGELLG